MNRNIIFMAIFTLLLTSCSKESPQPSADYMVLDEVEYVKGFPTSISLPDKGKAGKAGAGKGIFSADKKKIHREDK